ncbi:MAG: 16S rRNA (guanine(966)-N(2))-methyltransferase RsmD [Firmicutes bacterium]|nr:16S rRNA (guanine(966)-N(2))-methyltransferase RsmD [Bacillota bacterium]
MRVITGTARGRRLQSLKGQKTRPTQDRVKESLFSILGTVMVEGDFLDLYAGSGSIGIEALSRGAPKAVFVEKNKTAVQVIKSNLVHVGLEHKAEVYATDVFRGIGALIAREREFSCIFLDPPYDQDMVVPTLVALKAPLVTSQTIIVAEHSRLEVSPEHVGPFVRIRQQVYGDTVLSFFRHQV